MARRARGYCRLCGVFGPLTYEHVPPRRCFNRDSVAFHTFETMVKGFRTPAKYRGGYGRQSLCERCNGRTAAMYGEAFAAWTYKAMEYRNVLPARSRLLLTYTIQPLAVLKQICVMVLAMSRVESLHLPHFVDMRRFVLSPRLSGVTPHFRIYAYYAFGEARRATDFAGILNTIGCRGPVISYTELAFPPLGYCILNSGPAERGLAAELGLQDLTGFANFDYREVRSVELRMPALEPVGHMPLAYRR